MISRSMEPVDQKENYLVNEVFSDAHSGKMDQDLIADDLVLPIENEEINLAESVADNILLHIPLKVLTAEEEASDSMPSGNDWQVMTEEEYQKSKQAQKEKNSPFASLQGLFDEE